MRNVKAAHIVTAGMTRWASVKTTVAHPITNARIALAKTRHRLRHPGCLVCGARRLFGRGNDVHHVKTVRLFPELADDPKNLATLCRAHHFEWGHFKNWKNWNRALYRSIRQARRLNELLAARHCVGATETNEKETEDTMKTGLTAAVMAALVLGLATGAMAQTNVLTLAADPPTQFTDGSAIPTNAMLVYEWRANGLGISTETNAAAVKPIRLTTPIVFRATTAYTVTAAYMVPMVVSSNTVVISEPSDPSDPYTVVAKKLKPSRNTTLVDMEAGAK